MLAQRNAFVLLFAPDFLKLFGEAVRIYFCTCFEKDKNLVKGVSVYWSIGLSVAKDVLHFSLVFFVLRNVCQCHKHLVIHARYMVWGPRIGLRVTLDTRAGTRVVLYVTLDTRTETRVDLHVTLDAREGTRVGLHVTHDTRTETRVDLHMTQDAWEGTRLGLHVTLDTGHRDT
jgi:hypothetical protein